MIYLRSEKKARLEDKEADVFDGAVGPWGRSRQADVFFGDVLVQDVSASPSPVLRRLPGLPGSHLQPTAGGVSSLKPVTSEVDQGRLHQHLVAGFCFSFTWEVGAGNGSI